MMLESMSRLAGQNHADEQSEVAVSAAIKRDVMGEWIDPKNPAADIKQDKSLIKTHAETTELLDGELDALRSFCTIKISKMREQLHFKQADGGKSRKPQPGFTVKKQETSDLNCIVPDQLMNRIRLKNIRETVKQVTEAQLHESSVCPDCQKKQAELAKIAFVRRKKMLMESALIQEKLEEQIYSRDVLTHIGEALESFPKPSEDPRNLWQRLKALKNVLISEHKCSHLADQCWWQELVSLLQRPWAVGLERVMKLPTLTSLQFPDLCALRSLKAAEILKEYPYFDLLLNFS